MTGVAAFADWMERSLALWPAGLPAERTREYRDLLERAAPLWGAERFCWSRLPAAIGEVFGPRGWAWNGIYLRFGGTLQLAAAAGPPVCSQLERVGEVGSSGMCWDAVLMNQTLVTPDPAHWPGYVSCDQRSGLTTVAGLVCPLRGIGGAPMGVWDLDSVQPLAPEDPVFFDRFFATLSALLQPTTSDFEHDPGDPVAGEGAP